MPVDRAAGRQPLLAAGGDAQVAAAELSSAIRRCGTDPISQRRASLLDRPRLWAEWRGNRRLGLRSDPPLAGRHQRKLMASMSTRKI
jgi:hypothetical protein